MYGAVFVVLLLLVSLASYTPAGILQAIVPASVPAASKQGSTGTKFLIANGAYTNGHLVSVDASGNAVDFGTATALGTVNGQALNFNGSINLPAGAQLPSGLFFSQYVTKVVNTAGFSSIITTGAGSTTLPSGQMNTQGNMVRLRAGGSMAPNALGTSLTISWQFGGTQCASGAVALPHSGDSLNWAADVIATTYTTGATGTVYCTGQLVFVDTAAGTGTPVAIAGIDSGTAPTINLTGTLALDVLVAQTVNAGNFSTHNLYFSPY